MKFSIGNPPPRKRKDVSNALETFNEYLQMKAWISSGRAKPMETGSLLMGPEEQKKLDYKFPWRAASDSLKRFIKGLGLEADYHVKKYMTDTPGIWAVSVTYEPPPADAVPTQTTSKRRKTA